MDAGGQGFVLPTAHVERVLRIGPRDIQSVENRQARLVDGLPVSPTIGQLLVSMTRRRAG